MVKVYARLNKLALLTTVGACLSTGAWAQTAEQPESQPEFPESSSEIVVTGSSIRGVAAVGSTTIAVGREAIEATPAASTGDLFKDVPQVASLGVAETQRGVQGGAGNITYGTGINLRGIGPQATLVLLNGHRVARQGTMGGHIDPSVIPTIALERAEIVADGASGVYGSDAIAGVLNLILRRDLNGLETQVRYGFADDYFTLNAGLAVGKVWSTGQLMLAYEFSKHPRLRGSDRDFYDLDLRDRGGSDLRRTFCSPGTIQIAGVNYPLPSGAAGQPNRCDSARFADIVPEQIKHNLAFTFRQDFGDSVRVFGDAFLYEREFDLVTSVSGQSVTVPNTNAFYINPPGTNAPSQIVNFSFARDAGLRSTYVRGKANAYQGTLGAEIDLGGDWQLTALATGGQSDEYSTSNGVNPGLLAAGLASSNPATAINPYGVGQATNPAVIAALFNYTALRAAGTNTQYQLQAKIDGSLFDLPGGRVRMALGVERAYEKLENGATLGAPGAMFSLQNVSDRRVSSGFVEVVIPIFGADNAVPGIERLLINVAGRIDNYSDVGSTVNPKLGVTWDISNGLSLRGSYGTSFRAPERIAVSQTPALFAGTLPDPLSPTGFSSGLTRTGGNPDLKPEEATTWSIGADWQPPSVPGLKASTTFFSIALEGQLASYIGNPTVLQRESIFASIITRNPTPAQLAPLLAGAFVNGIVPSPVSWLIDGRARNLGSIRMQGIDFDLRYRYETENSGAYTIGLNGSYLTRYDYAVTPTSPSVDRRSFVDFPIKYRMRGNIGWSMGSFTAIAYGNYQPSYTNDTVAPFQRVSGQLSADLFVSYDLERVGLGNAKFSVNIQNVFDQDPPFYNGLINPNLGGGYDAQKYSAVGRIVTVGISTKF